MSVGGERTLLQFLKYMYKKSLDYYQLHDAVTLEQNYMNQSS